MVLSHHNYGRGEASSFKLPPLLSYLNQFVFGRVLGYSDSLVSLDTHWYLLSRPLFYR